MESKRNEINWRSYFWKETYRIDLDPRSEDEGGDHEGRGAPTPLGRTILPRGFLAASLTSTPSLLNCVCSKNGPREGFIPFGLRLILRFFETLK